MCVAAVPEDMNASRRRQMQIRSQHDVHERLPVYRRSTICVTCTERAIIRAPDESESGNKLLRHAKESKDLVLHLRTFSRGAANRIFVFFSNRTKQHHALGWRKSHRSHEQVRNSLNLPILRNAHLSHFWCNVMFH